MMTIKLFVAGLAACVTLAGCARIPATRPASLATFGGLPFMDAPAAYKHRPHLKPAARVPVPHPKSECGQVSPERCLLNKGIIGSQGGSHEK